MSEQRTGSPLRMTRRPGKCDRGGVCRAGAKNNKQRKCCHTSTKPLKLPAAVMLVSACWGCCPKPRSARADCTPSGQFAPSVISEYHADERESQGQSRRRRCEAPLTFSFCVVRNQHRRAICSRGFELPPAGAAAKARGGEAPKSARHPTGCISAHFVKGVEGKPLARGGTTTPPLVFHVPTPDP